MNKTKMFVFATTILILSCLMAGFSLLGIVILFFPSTFAEKPLSMWDVAILTGLFLYAIGLAVYIIFSTCKGSINRIITSLDVKVEETKK